MNTQSSGLVLIVDDNPENLRVLGGIIEQYGYSAAFALSGMEALSFLGSERPDCILLDIMMPEMDGYEVCSLIKKNAGTRDIPVIFLTAKTETDDVVRGFETGAVDYVTKPFRPPELLARMRTHIELKRAREEIRTLRGVLPVCANCKSIRNEGGDWEPIENYLKSHTEADFSHGLCPRCIRVLYPQISETVLEEIEAKKEQDTP